MGSSDGPIGVFYKLSPHSNQVNTSFLYQLVSVSWFRDSSDTDNGYVYHFFDLLGLRYEVALYALQLLGSTAASIMSTPASSSFNANF